jgi:hypothetical protein
MLEAEPENPVSAWKQALKQESPWVSMRLKEETIDAIAEFGVRKQQEAAMIREWEVGMAIGDALNQRIAELPPKLQERVFKFYATGSDESDRMFSKLYKAIRRIYRSVWESLVKKSETMSPEQNSMSDTSTHRASISSNSDEWFFSVPNSPLRDYEQQTVSSILEELDHLHAMSSVQAETLDSQSNHQQSPTSSREITVTNQETDPASSRSKDLDKRSSVRDSNQNRKPTSRSNLSWSGLMKTCRGAKDTQVIEPTHIPRQKPRQRTTRKEAGPS